MNPERWQKAIELFHAALEQDPRNRQAFLDVVCSGDAEMRRQVENLLAKQAAAQNFLETPAMGYATVADTSVCDPPRELGPFRVVSLLGAGGMGEVYRAHDRKLGRDVAIKILPPRFARDRERLTRFRREARALASLNHPNIAAIYGLEESEDGEYLVLELVEGETLRGPLPMRQALDYAGQVAEALDAAHHQGIIHRDLKPANVKLTPQGKIKVLDFGLAKAVWGAEADANLGQAVCSPGAETLAGRALGTPGYMSPEQTRGEAVDQRTDIWAFGCLLYELLTGQRAFVGETVLATVAGVLERQPDWQALPAKTPARIRELLRQCLQKHPSQRMAHIADARRAIEEAQRGRSHQRTGVVAAAMLVLFVAGIALWLRSPAPPPKRSDWAPLTRFPDPVSQPALSPDGRLLAFVRSSRTDEQAIGQLYLKTLPDGEPVQLTNDAFRKGGPAFSPDGLRVAYTVVDPQFHWETWVAPVHGGEPKPWLPNAAYLNWIDRRQLLFSEIRKRPLLGVVSALEDRTRLRDVYMPVNDRGMAKRSYPSPDGKWVLVAEIGAYGNWERCRVVRLDGTLPAHMVGPPAAPCTSGAWSPDGKWIYVTSKAGGLYHIWRQRFPNGQSEQITFGPTEEEGIAMFPDGRSFVTAVAVENSSLWIHDERGERQISILEGNAAYPKFAPDGKKLYYRIVQAVPRFGTNRDPGEVWVVDLASGHSERVAPGFEPLDYDISRDGRQIVMDALDSEGKPRFWLAPLDHHGTPRRIPNAEGRQALFGPGGEIFFRHVEGSGSFLYRIRPDGTGLRKVMGQEVLSPSRVPPGEGWISIWGPLPGNRPSAVQVVPIGGGTPIVIGSNTLLEWSSSGDSVWIMAGPVRDGRTYAVPLDAGKILPPIPEGGFHSEEEVAALPGARSIDAAASPGPTIGVYAFTRHTTQRNLYRIPIP